MIKKGILTLVLTAITVLTFAQSQHITSAAIIFKQYKSEKDKSVKALKIKDAKEFIDKAYNNESTSNAPKMWMYRAKIYKMIALNHASLDSDAIFKATESHLKCMQPHPKKKNKIMIYKKWPKEEVLEGLVQCGNRLFNQAIEEYHAGNYKRSIELYNTIFDIIPFDEEDQLKRRNITKETILYNSFFSSNKMKDNKKSKKFLQQLIDINFNEPKIFSYMSNIYFEEGNSDKALEYIALGRDIFESDQGLIADEINLYIKLEKTEELIEKLSKAIDLDPENELLFLTRGNIYYDTQKLINAEKDYGVALSLDQNNFLANYMLGVLSFNNGTNAINKANETSSNSLHKKLKKQSDNFYKNALPYMLKAFEIDPTHKENLTSLKELYYRLGNYAKSKEMKKIIAELKGNTGTPNNSKKTQIIGELD